MHIRHFAKVVAIRRAALVSLLNVKYTLMFKLNGYIAVIYLIYNEHHTSGQGRLLVTCAIRYIIDHEDCNAACSFSVFIQCFRGYIIRIPVSLDLIFFLKQSRYLGAEMT